MFDSRPDGGSAAVLPPSGADLDAFIRSLRTPDTDLDDTTRLQRIRRLEQLKAAVAAAQAVDVAAFVTSRRKVTAAEIASTPRVGVGKRRRTAEAERGIVHDVAIARRESSAQASRFIGFALTAPSELPHTFRLLATGAVSERRALSLHHATEWLNPDHRRAADHEIAGDLPGLGDRHVLTRAAAAAARLDPHGACDRIARAEAGRRVSMRPAPESMVWLTALLPLTDGVATWAALDRAATHAKATGDTRTRGQVMADTLFHLVTGRTEADGVAIELQLVMTDQTLLDQGDSRDEPVRVVGHGILPARYGRDLFLRGPDGDGGATGNTADPEARRIRRLFTDPAGRLVAMEADSRCFTPAMRRFITVRDDVCRTPWCDAPIRHIDHVTPAAQHGRTAVHDGRGYCERCNYTAQAPGMVSVAIPRDGTITTRTPTGQHHRSTEPSPPRTRPLHHAPISFDLVWPQARAA